MENEKEEFVDAVLALLDKEEKIVATAGALEALKVLASPTTKSDQMFAYHGSVEAIGYLKEKVRKLAGRTA